MQFDVVIVGGGLSGLAASIQLSQENLKINLIEKNSYLGGRARSFIENKTGDEIDDGQHLILGCYKNSFQYLKKIKSLSLLKFHNNLEINFRFGKRKFKLKAWNLPAPFHIIFSLLNLKSLQLKERINLIRIGFALFYNEKNISNLTVEEWLNSHKQSQNAKNYLWNVISVGALNGLPQNTSAEIFKNILKEIFLYSNKNSRFVISKLGLSKIFVEGAVKHLETHRVKISYNEAIEKILIHKNSVIGVELKNGNIIKTNSVVLSVPHSELKKIVTNSKIENDFKYLDQLSFSPILNIHLWFDKYFMKEEFISILDSPLHWIFNKSESSKLHYLTIVISAAHEYINWNNQNILEMCKIEIEKVFPDSKNAKLIHHKIIKQKRATFLQTPTAEKYRPENKTSINGLFIAGDWTKTNLPATIEGAILSGNNAAELVKKYLIR